MPINRESPPKTLLVVSLKSSSGRSVLLEVSWQPAWLRMAPQCGSLVRCASPPFDYGHLSTHVVTPKIKFLQPLIGGSFHMVYKGNGTRRVRRQMTRPEHAFIVAYPLRRASL
jgi:hypothetical protein